MWEACPQLKGSLFPKNNDVIAATEIESDMDPH